MNEKLDFTAYLDHIKADYLSWTLRGRSMDELSEINKQMIQEFNDGLTVELGSKYAKVITDRGNQRSVHSFIVIKADKKFPVGTILKAASWAAPAKNFTRGTIQDGNFSRIAWTGAQ